MRQTVGSVISSPRISSREWDWFDRIPKPQKRGLIAFHETDDNVAERNLGAFAGWPSANDWTMFGGIQHCCTGNGARAIYYIWENILDFEECG